MASTSTKKIISKNANIKKSLIQMELILNFIYICLILFKKQYNLTISLLKCIPEALVLFFIFKISRPQYEIENGSKKVVDSGTSLENRGFLSIVFDFLYISMVVRILSVFSSFFYFFYIFTFLSIFYEFFIRLKRKV